MGASGNDRCPASAGTDRDLPRIRFYWPRWADLCDGWNAEGTHFGFSGWRALDGAAGARLIRRGGRRAWLGYVVTRAARRRRMRSRRRWVALAVTMTSVMAIDSVMGSHGVSSDGLGDCGGVSGSGSP